MLISELIKELEEVKSDIGDIRVRIDAKEEIELFHRIVEVRGYDGDSCIIKVMLDE